MNSHPNLEKMKRDVLARLAAAAAEAGLLPAVGGLEANAGCQMDDPGVHWPECADSYFDKAWC